MNQRFPLLLATAATALLVPIAVTVAQEAAKTEAKAEVKTEAVAKIPEGQKLFLDNGCTSCHSMKGQGIEKKKSATTTAATEPPAASTTPATPAAGKPPDLSAVGLEHDKGWITKFLLKTETLHDKKHMKTWKGTDEQLATLSAWLADQKNAEAAGLKVSADKAVKEAEEAKQGATEAKQEAKEAKQDAEKAADQADQAKKDADKAKEQSQGK